MPGYGSIAEVPAAWLSAATVMTGLWIGDRLISPVQKLRQCRREIEASLVVAFSLRDTVAGLAGKDDIDALNALSDARKDLKALAERLASFAHSSRLPVRVYSGIRGYNLTQAAEGLKRLSDSLVAASGRRLMDQATVMVGLRLGRRHSLRHRLGLT